MVEGKIRCHATHRHSRMERLLFVPFFRDAIVRLRNASSSSSFFSRHIADRIADPTSYQTYLQLSPIQTTLRFLTCAIVGVGINVVVALISSKVSAQYLIMIGALGTSLAPLLFAVQSYSSYSGYWAFEFPAMALAVTGADFIFSLGQSRFSLSTRQGRC